LNSDPTPQVSPSPARASSVAREFPRAVGEALLLAAAAFFLAALLFITLSRIRYPYALEWLEGTSLIHVQRILAGELIYVEPTLSFVPLSYPPVYYYVGAAATLTLGPGFLPLRVVSLLSSLGCFGLIFCLVRRQGGTVTSALTSVGLFAAMFRISGAWYDIARVDMLATLLMLAGVLLSCSRGVGRTAAAGALMALACLTKQSFIVVLVALSVHGLLFRRNRAAVAFAVSAATIYLASVAALDWLHGGWFKFFVFELPRRHDLLREIAFATRYVWLERMILTLPVVTALAIYYVLRGIRRDEIGAAMPRLGSDAAALGTVLAATVLLAWSGLANPGGYDNVLVPALAMLAPLAGLGLHHVRSLDRKVAIRLSVEALALLQFVLLSYPIAAQIPSDTDARAGAGLVELLREQPGEVLVPYHPELAWLAGKPTYANYIALYELEGGQGGGDADLWRVVRGQLQTAFRTRKFSLILLDKEQFWGGPQRYYEASLPPLVGEEFYPVTGWKVRPVIVFGLPD